ncbi:MAG: PepSY-associated TM helix domain-containing protein [Bacteroidota bacterium]
MENKKEANKHLQTVYKRRLAKFSRWLHIYLSMISFVIVLFFSVTGITLNHVDYFQGQTQTTQTKGKLPADWVNNTDTNRIAKLNVVEFFRNTHAVKGAVNDFRIEESQVSVAFKGPGYEAVIFIDRKTGEYNFSQSQTGFVGFMNDLHKGRDTGKVWGWVIDIAAGLMVIISLSGLILLLFIKRKRVNGMILLGAGLVLIYLVYRIWGQ